MTLQEMRTRKAALVDQASALDAKAKTENRDLTAEETAQIDGILDEADALAEQIKTGERAEARTERLTAHTQALKAAVKPRVIPGTTFTPEEGLEVLGATARHDKSKRFGFVNAGDFYRTIAAVATPGSGMRHDDRLDGLFAAATGMNVGDPASGGFAVPPAFSNQIWGELDADPDNLMPLCDTYTIEGESLDLLTVKDVSKASGSIYGGAIAYWMAEADQMTASNPKLRKIKLEPKELGAYIPVTNKLLTLNAVALEQFITRAASGAIMYQVNDAIVNGSGAGKPQGVLASACRVVVAKESQQTATTIKGPNVDNMWARLYGRSRANSKWFYNQDCEGQFGQMVVGTSTVNQMVYLPPGGLSAAPYGMLKGRPALPLDYCQTLGAEGDIILADFKAYALGIHGGIESAMSMHIRFDYNESVFRFMFAVDGQPWLNTTIAAAKGSATYSPFVVLAVRS